MKIRLYNPPKKIGSEKIKRAVEYFGELLMTKRMLSSLSITVKFSETHRDENFEDGSCTWEDDYVRPKEFTIILHSYKSEHKLLTTLAHEMVHVKQFATGELRDLISNAHSISWRGKRFDTRKINYWDYPWEIDAHGRELGMYVRFRDMLEKERKDERKIAKTAKPGCRRSKATIVS